MHTPQPNPTLRFWSIRLLFAVEALAFALLLPRLPEIKAALDLSEADLGVSLLGIPAGTLVGFVVAPRIVRSAGPRAASWVSVACLAFVFILPALAGSQSGLLVAFGACGVCIGHTEVALNSKAGSMETSHGSRIMSQCHGFWSIGAVAAVLAGGWLAKAGISVLHQSMGAAVLLAAGAALLAVFLPPDPREPAASLADTMTVLPPWSLLPLCLLPVGIMIVEGVVMDWSAVYMREILDADPFSAALGFASFSAAMAVVRLSGDALAARFGDRPVVVLSSIAAGAGTAVFAFAGSVAGAVVGAAVCGAGIATVYPIALSAAARAPGPAERNIAAVSFTSFLVLLGSPAAFGFAAEELGYRLALGLCATLALPTVVLSKALQSSLAAAHAKPSTGQ